MNPRMFENGIVMSLIFAAVFAAGLGAEYWLDTISRHPSQVDVEASYLYDDESLVASATYSEMLGKAADDIPEPVRSPAHIAIISDPEKRYDLEYQYQQLLALSRAEANSPALFNDLGVFAIRRSDFEQAIVHLKRSLELKPDYARAYFNLGISYAGIDRFDEAEQAYKSALQISKGYQAAAMNLAILYLNNGRLDEARAYFDRAVDLSSGSVKSRALKLLGRTDLRMGNVELAVIDLRAAIEYNPRDAEAWLDLGRALANLDGKHQEAIETLEKSIALNDSLAAAHYLIADLYQKTGFWKKAMAELKRALIIDPGHVPTRELLAELLQDYGDIEEASSHLAWLADNLADDKQASYYRALKAENDRDYAGAIDILMATYSEEGALNRKLLRKLGILLRRTARYEEALDLYERYMDAFPEDSAAYVGAIGTALSQEDYSGADAYLARALAADLRTADLFFMQGRLYDATGEDGKAISAYESCLVLDADYSRCALNLAVLWSKYGDFEQAVKLYQGALARSPRYLSARFNLALSLTQLDRADEAAAEYERILEVDASHLGARLNLANIRKQQDRLQDAEMLLTDGLAIDPGDVSMRFNYALLLRALGKRDEQIKELKRVVRLDPGFDKGWRSLARAEADREDFDAAAVAWLHALHIDSSAGGGAAFRLAQRTLERNPSNQDAIEIINLVQTNEVAGRSGQSGQ